LIPFTKWVRRDGLTQRMSEAERAIASVLAQAAATEGLLHAAASFGPMGVDLRCDHVGFVTSVQRAAVAESSLSKWPSLRVFMLTEKSLSFEALPTPLQPHSTKAAVRVINTPRYTCLVNQHLLWVADRESATILRWSRSEGSVPEWESVRPLRFALNWWAAENGSALLHAGVVAYEGKAVVLAGKGGTGKSTTVCACLDSQLSVLADDYCLVEPATSDSDATVHALFGVGHVNTRSIELLPSLRSRVIHDDPETKSLVRLIDHAPSPARITAIATITRRPGADTQIRTTSRSDVLRLAAPSTIAQSDGAHEHIWRVLTRVVQTSRAWDLQVGSLPDVPGAILEALQNS